MKKLKMTKAMGNLLLIAVTLMWGSGFVATKFCLENGMNSGMINIFRGGILMMLTIAIFPKRVLKMRPKEALIGICAGAANGIAFLFQGWGQEYASPSISSFITVLYVIFVPIMMLIFFRQKPKMQIIPAVILALVGTYFLTGVSFAAFSLGKGEILSLICSVFFGLSIVIIGAFGGGIDAPIMSFWIGVTHTLSGVAYFFISGGIKTVGDANWLVCILPLLWLGAFCTFFTSTAQVVSQKVTDETTASIIMALEAFFGTMFSLIFGYDKFGWKLGLGGALILMGTFVAVADFDRILAFFKRKFGKAPSETGEVGATAVQAVQDAGECASETEENSTEIDQKSE